MFKATETRKKERRKRLQAILVPHTHWDREWYSPFEVFRGRLVKMMDNLLNILAHDPKFSCFTLDGQVIPVEDYLEVRPEREADIKRYVKQGRIVIGPFYVLPDNFLVSGEAQIRNLLLGLKLAEKLGRSMKVGYIPDAFGQIAQMPQILKGFGIDTVVFSRGMGDEADKLKSEFIWRAPDGTSSVLTHWLVLHYDNLRDISTNMSSALAYILRVASMLKTKATTNSVLLMNGTDHAEAQPHVPVILEVANESNPDIYIRIGSFSDYFELVKSANPDLQILEGEFRSSKYQGVVKGVTSARTYLKQANVETQMLLEKWVEPFDAWAWSLGERHNHGLIWEAWKQTLQCHPHDSICGCGVDWIHEEMMKRLTVAQQLGESVLRNDLLLIASKIDVNPDAYSIVVFNPLSWTRTDAVELTIFTKKSSEKFELVDPEGRLAEFSILREKVIESVLTKKIKEKVLDIVFLAEEVPSCGYKTYTVKPVSKDKGAFEGREKSQQTSPAREGNTIENEFLKVSVQENGSLTLVDKRDETTYVDFNILEDGGDVGDEYNYDRPREDKLFLSSRSKARLRLLESGAARSTLKIEYELTLPASSSDDRKTRKSDLFLCPVTAYVSLFSKVPRVDIQLEFENNAKDHRLRVLFPTRMTCDYSHADQAFHVIKRPTAIPAGEGWVEPPAPTHALQSFVSVSDGEKGLTIATKGLQEYEVKNDGTIAVTLLRCVGWLSREDLSSRPGAAGPIISTPNAQCQGKHSFSYSIIPHKGTWEEARAYLQAMQHQAPMRTVQIVKHDIGALGDLSLVPSEFKGLVVRPTTSPSLYLPPRLSFISVRPNNMLVSAIKRAEDGSGVIVRAYNTTNESVIGELSVGGVLIGALPVNMREEVLMKDKAQKKTRPNSVKKTVFEAQPFRVNTFRLVLASVNTAGKKGRGSSTSS